MSINGLGSNSVNLMSIDVAFVCKRKNAFIQFLLNHLKKLHERSIKLN